MRSLFSFGLLLTVLSFPVWAQTGDPHSTIHIKKTHESILLDGILDEPAWEAMEPATHFWQNFPVDTLQAQNQTEVYMTYDDENLYVAIKCYSSHDKYITQSLRRDYRAGGSDNVTLMFDTFNDGMNSFVFGMNPFGVRREALIANGGQERTDFNESWDNKWKGAAKIHEGYWVGEAAIPFKTLRYKEGSTRWRFNSYRFDTQTNERSAWQRVPQNQLIMGLVAAVLVFLAFSYAAARIRVTGGDREAYVTRGTMANLLETLCVFVRDQVAKPNLEHLTDKYIKYLWTVFFFILFCNLLGMVPLGYMMMLIASLFGVEGQALTNISHWGGTATGNLSLNIPLALMSLILIIAIGIREAGFAHFAAHFTPGPVWMAPLMVPLEIMGLLIKCTVLAMRLFGTMMAGHLVISAFLGLIPVGLVASIGVGIPVVIGGTALMLLEVFIAMLQAFIFTFLTTLFIASFAVVHHEDDHGHDHAHEPQAIAA